MSLLYSKPLPANWEVPTFSLKGTDDKTYTLASFQDKDGLLIIFNCNHCPYAKAAWSILIDLHKEFGHKINFVGINPNNSDLYQEDSFEAMQVVVKKLGIKFPYLRDENQETAEQYEAQCTPDLYLFKKSNENFELFYHGRINDSWDDPESVTEENLKEALQKLTNNESVPINQPPSMGCSIKWK